MRWLSLISLPACLIAIVTISTPGCTSAESAEVTALRKKYLLASEPANPLTIEQGRAEKGAVTIVGQIDLIDVDPFVDGKAAFAISEAPDPSHGHASVTEASNCPFCRRKALKAPTASVEFQDEQGNPVGIDSRELFDLKKGQVVVVQGIGNFDEKINVFKIKPTSLYVRR